MSANQLRIDLKSLQYLLDKVNSFGFNPETKGHNRIGFSDADMAVRNWFAEELAAEGLIVVRDGAGNIFGRFGPSDGPCIMAGSHLDTVPEGGAFDGSLGVCVALECVKTIRNAGLRPKYAIEVAATAEEEGRFGGMLGSQAIAGVLTREWIDQAADGDGKMLVDAMNARGFDPYEALNAARRKGSVRAFLELHIEQGPVLENLSVPIGIADSVSGVCNLQVSMEGTANHSGTTPMNLRADAFAGMAEVAHAIPGVIAKYGGEYSRVTIGKAEIRPNFIHTVPGFAEFFLNIRDTDNSIIDALGMALENEVKRAASKHNLAFTIFEQSKLAPVELDRGISKMLKEEAEKLGLRTHAMPSGAGHDAQTMQTFCPSGLIFVPSRNGISHSPDERTDWRDIEKGATLMLAALVRFSEAS
jgi:hydantoinase/carbamoylase family amidase